MRTYFITHAGKQILLQDFSRLETAADALARFDEARRLVAAQPKERTLRVLTDVSGSAWDTAVVDGIRALAEHNAPWVMCSALIGVTPMMRVVARALLLITGRRIAIFKDPAAARDWLCAQERPPEKVPSEE